MTESNQGPATPGTAARCEDCAKHEGCIEEMRKDFDLTLDQQLDRAEAAEKRVAELEQSLRNIYEAQGWRKLLGETAAGPAEPAKEAVPEIERLKAENASLLESLREKELYAEQVRLRSVDYAQQLKESRSHAAAAERRAEAAEKRNTELQVALRAACGHLDRAAADIWGRNHGSLDQFARHLDSIADQVRAALHDEERSASPQEGEGGK